jgi:AraC-like DNA-binding protein/Tfp pilus assembly protein PilF
MSWLKPGQCIQNKIKPLQQKLQMHVMRHSVLCVLLLSSLATFGQNRSLDSVSTFLQQYHSEDTIRVNALNNLSYQYQWINLNESVKNADQALALAQKLGFLKGEATAYASKGFCYWAFGDNELSIANGLKAAAIAEAEGSMPLIAESSLILARAYMDQNQHEKALTYLQRAEKIAHITRNWDHLSRAYNLRGVIHFLDHRVDSALHFYNKALSIAQAHKIAEIHFARIISNIGECYLKENPAKAQMMYDNALSKAKETGNVISEASILSVMGHAYLHAKNYARAEDHFLKSLKLSRAIGLRRVIRHVYSGLASAKMQQGDATKAIEYLKRYYEVRDSLLNTVKTRQIVEMESRYELEKKEQNIKLLEQQKHIQTIWRNILIAAVAALILLVFLVYYLQKYRARKNHEILNLEIDYLTRRHAEISDKYKNSMLGEDEKTIESQDQRLLKKAIGIVEENISDPLFGVEKMAKEMGMSRTNMHRKIKGITGFPPSELIRTIRLRKAAVLLLNQADSVSQISIAVGFDDHSYFSKAFKKQFGVPPSEYIHAATLQEELVK